MDITRNWEENYFGLTKSISCFLANRRKIRCHFRYTEILYLLCITVLSLYGMQFLLFTQSSILKLPTRFVDQNCSPAPSAALAFGFSSLLKRRESTAGVPQSSSGVNWVHCIYSALPVVPHLRKSLHLSLWKRHHQRQIFLPL